MKSGVVVGEDSVHARFLLESKLIPNSAKDATKMEISSPTKTSMVA